MSATPILIGFCGEIYPCVATSTTVRGSYKDQKDFIYSVEDYLKFIQNYQKGLANEREDKRFRSDFDGRGFFFRSILGKKECTTFFDKKTHGNLKSLFVSYKVPIFKIEHSENARSEENPSVYARDGGSLLTLNPKLIELNFVTIKDPHTAFQEIAQYLSGVLGINNKEPEIIADKYLIEGKGFDNKYSFRRDKSK